MLHAPKVCDPRVTVADVARVFSDDHVHAVLIVDADGRLRAVVERADIRDADSLEPAVVTGALTERVISPDAVAEAVRKRMVAQGRRRLAVVDEHGVLIGLLCLKRSGLGFCSDSDVEARARDLG